ncbi:hypothetical protein FG385_02340 [Amycolatopsis alkalitolerans]|uniref:DMT family transporter n=1 Tax=Amycolatopsis alkalitolerans TaxID=2547244 RepID=A0A5C4MCS2_9PSEU|nr:hypothetical protein FG385_02340 [Amycolatopsis alkalitolerans]
MLGVVFAVLAAATNAAGSVMQRTGARKQPEGSRLSRDMLLHLVTQRVWIAGVLTTLAGLGLQALALANAPIVVVQSLLVSELGFVLVLSSVVFRTRLPAREWAALAGLGAGVALLLVSLSPGGGRPHVPVPTWLLASGVTVATVAVLVAIGVRYRHVRRAAYLGIAAGMWFGFTAVLIDGITADGLFSAWQTYAMVVAGPAGFFLLQNALRAGPLVASQPGLTLANPLVALGWGVAVFGEQVRGGPWLAGSLIAAALIAACTLQLAGSHLLDDAE